MKLRHFLQSNCVHFSNEPLKSRGNPPQIISPSEHVSLPFHTQGDGQFIHSMEVQASPNLKILNKLFKYKEKATL